MMPNAKASRAPKDRTDWNRLKSLSEAQIEAMAKADADNPATREDDWAGAVVGIPPLKTSIHAMFDTEVVNWFKAQGKGYQTRMNAVLRRYYETHNKKAG